MSPEAVCQEVYGETRQLYARVEAQLGPAALGFRILYGPPVVDAPYLFLGYQPGGRAPSAAEGIAEGHHEGWPDHCVFASAAWPLAREIRYVFGETILERCTGLNAIFFRSPNIALWHRVPPNLRYELEKFSAARARKIVEALQPRHLVVIGLRTFDRLTAGEPMLRGERGSVLVKRGELWGCETSGVVHLSGARISRDDRARIATVFHARSSN